MAQYVELEAARALPGLRLTLVQGHAGPWAEAAKGIFYVKKLPFVRVRHDMQDADYVHQLQAWSGQTSYPIAIYDDESPRTTWTGILFLAERLAPDPPLIPTNAKDRALMFGYSHELCGEEGLCWAQRLMGFERGLASGPLGKKVPLTSPAFQQKYGYSPGAAAAAPQRLVDIMRLFSAQIAEQYAQGRRFLVGDRLSALDIYWATFFSRLFPLPEEHCAMELRTEFIEMLSNHPLIMSASDPILFQHRDFIYHSYLELPVEL